MVLEENVGHKYCKVLEAIELDIHITCVLTKHVIIISSIILVVCSLELDLVDSVDTLLGCGFKAFSFVFISPHNVVGSGCYKFVRGYKHFWGTKKFHCSNVQEDFWA